MEKLVAVQEISQSQHLDGVSIDTKPLVSLNSDARRQTDLFMADLSQEDAQYYKITPDRLLRSIYGVCHVC